MATTISRRKFCTLAAAALATAALPLSACGARDDDNDNFADSGIAVVVFSATGNTSRVARQINGAIESDLIELSPADLYSDEDIDYGNEARAKIEQNDADCRPELAEVPNLSGYDTVFLGFPIWYDKAPRLILTLIDSGNLDGKRVIPFCTSESSGIDDAAQELADVSKSNGNDITWEEGQRFAVDATQDVVVSWAKQLV